uniref:RING-type E3 ubiquitin transferase n=1 Tax=Petromyzon marinus TaxID=7757 RepID=A0AAJ7X1R9_PETMA|nr:E3 ubiquitin-protein ligase MIB2-like [Petromyzon marinus]
MLEVGVRVVRGRDWRWAEQDGGEGHAGTVVLVARRGEQAAREARTVVVQWDTGVRADYRAGFQGAHDLLLLDNAQIGVRHPNIACDACGTRGLAGLRWRCLACPDFDLCTRCYAGNRHELAHAFERHEHARAVPVAVGCRLGLQRVPLMGTFPGAKVVRGVDWEWGDQDGGAGGVGRVTELRGWDGDELCGMACVLWEASGSRCVYRAGHRGRVDLRCVSPALGGHYFREHLPSLGHGAALCGSERLSSASPLPASLFRPRDAVRCDARPSALRVLQRGHGGWNSEMTQNIGRLVRAYRVTESGDVRVAYPGGTRWTYNPHALTKVPGAMGRVASVLPDGAVRVPLADDSACLSAAAPEEAARPKTRGASSLGSLLEVVLRGGPPPPSSRPSSPRGVPPGLLLVTHAALGHVRKMRALLDAFPDEVDAQVEGKTALQVSAHLGHGAAVSLLLERGADAARRDPDGDTALHYAAYGSREAVCELLLTSGADPDAVNASGCSALHVAANRGYAEVARVLCDHACDVNVQDACGDTALHDALAKEARGVAALLLDAPSADFSLRNRHGFNILHQAALKGNQQATSVVLERARQLVDVAKEDGYRPVHLAAFNNHAAVVRMLLRQGRCDADAATGRLQTALALAAGQGHAGVVLALVRDGACSTNVRDAAGRTALHAALGARRLHAAPWRPQPASGDEAEMLAELRESGLFPEAAPVGVAIACFLAQCGGDLFVRDHAGRSPLGLEPDPGVRQLLGHFAQRHRRWESGSVGGPVTLRRVHTTPLMTMTNLAGVEQLGGGECLVCSEPCSPSLLLPCQHRLACEGCSLRMKRCFKCQVTITKKLREDGSVIECPARLSCFPLPGGGRDDCAGNVKGPSPGTSGGDGAGTSGSNSGDENDPGGGGGGGDDDAAAAAAAAEEEAEGLAENGSALRLRCRDMEARLTCAVCMERPLGLVFSCGHAACTQCGLTLRACPLCRRDVTERTHIYV